MSYILDALRKVERDRVQPEVPNINLGIVDEKSSRQRWGIILLIGLVVMNLGWFAYNSISQQSMTEERTIAVRSDDANKNTVDRLNSLQPHQADINESSERVETVSPVTNAETDNRQSRNSSPQSIADLMARTTQLNVPKQVTRKPIVGNQPVKSKPPINRPNAIKPSRPALNPAPARVVHNTPGGRDNTTPKRQQKTELKKSPTKITPTSVEARKKPQTVKQVPMLRHMSAEFQEQIPEININVYVHADNMADAFVIINMRKYKVGDRINPDIKLIDIGVDGITLRKNGKEFQVARP